MTRGEPLTTAPSHSPDANTTVLPLPFGNSSPPAAKLGSLANDPPAETNIRIWLASSASADGGGGGGGVPAKVAAIVWSLTTFVNVTRVRGPTDTESTNTSATWRPGSGEMKKVMLAPSSTSTAPLGKMLPPGPAVAVIV